MSTVRAEIADPTSPLYRGVVGAFGAGLRDVLETLVASGDLAIQAPRQRQASPSELAQAPGPVVAFPFALEGPFLVEGILLLGGPVLLPLVGALVGDPTPPEALGAIHVPVLRDSLAGVCGRWGQALGEQYGGYFEATVDSIGDPTQPAYALAHGLAGEQTLTLEQFAVGLGPAVGDLVLALSPASVLALAVNHPMYRPAPPEANPMPFHEPLEPTGALTASGIEYVMEGGTPSAMPSAPVQAPMPDINISRPAFQQLQARTNGGHEGRGIDLILDVPLTISVELGRKDLNIREILDLVPGSLIELDKLAGEPLDLLINGKLFAKGEVVVIDENFGIRVTTIISPEERILQLR